MIQYEFSRKDSNLFILLNSREMKQTSDILYKLLNGLSQAKIRMTPQQQLFCQQVVERVRLID
jgi:hypothetical protein